MGFVCSIPLGIFESLSHCKQGNLDLLSKATRKLLLTCEGWEFWTQRGSSGSCILQAGVRNFSGVLPFRLCSCDLAEGACSMHSSLGCTLFLLDAGAGETGAERSPGHRRQRRCERCHHQCWRNRSHCAGYEPSPCQPPGMLKHVCSW